MSLPAPTRSWRAWPWVQPLLDAVLIFVSFWLAWYMRYRLQWFAEVDPAFGASFEDYAPFAGVACVLMGLLYAANGAYVLRRGATWLDEAARIVSGTLTGFVVLMAITFYFRPLVYSRLLLLEAAALIVCLLSIGRMVRQVFEGYLRTRGHGLERVLIIGAGEVGRAVMRTMVARPDLGYAVLGYLDDDPEKAYSTMARYKGLGQINDLARVLHEHALDEVIIALPWTYHRRILTVLQTCTDAHVRARVVPDILRLSLSRVDVDDLGGIPLIGVKEPGANAPARLGKRLIDLLIIALSAPVTVPLAALVALAVRLDSPGPVLFRQMRVGLHGRHFEIYKFRSMHTNAEEQRHALEALNEADGPLFKIRNDPRITRVGRIIRKLSLDELPQLFNILRGEMSLVGPRPPLPDEVARYQPWQTQRLAVPPGLSGLAQVSGRSDLSFDEVCLLDIYYVEQWSLALDIQIMLRTIPRIVLGSGAY